MHRSTARWTRAALLAATSLSFAAAALAQQPAPPATAAASARSEADVSSLWAPPPLPAGLVPQARPLPPLRQAEEQQAFADGLHAGERLPGPPGRAPLGLPPPGELPPGAVTSRPADARAATPCPASTT